MQYKSTDRVSTSYGDNYTGIIKHMIDLNIQDIRPQPISNKNIIKPSTRDSVVFNFPCGENNNTMF